MSKGFNLFIVPAPNSLIGKTLAESQIGELGAGLIVIALEEGKQRVTNPRPDRELTPGCKLLMLGTDRQRQAFTGIYED